MPIIYPLLKPHDWPHQRLVAHRKLMDDPAGVPIVAFGFDTGDNYQFVPANQCDDVDKLYQEALANLAKLDYPWETGESNGLAFVTSSGKEFSAERLLDPAAMQEAHRLLGADRIIVAAPRRTCLMAVRDGPALTTFVKLVMYTYHDDSYGHAPISPAMFVLEGGVIVGVMFATDEPEERRAPTSEQAQAVSRPWWKFWK